ncbi:hypothetical protein PENSPDRAFT_354708 [Peniophora sp. CONT]|nr:hypothetical protein PENSPDRAFT_354708 [Peniophora sp. CONT]
MPALFILVLTPEVGSQFVAYLTPCMHARLSLGQGMLVCNGLSKSCRTFNESGYSKDFPSGVHCGPMADATVHRTIHYEALMTIFSMSTFADRLRQLRSARTSSTPPHHETRATPEPASRRRLRVPGIWTLKLKLWPRMLYGV